MKKLGFLFFMIGVIFLAGCNERGIVEANGSGNQTLSSSGTTMPTEISCKDAIKKHLSNADKKGSGTQAKKGDKVKVHYVGRLNDEEVFDTSIEEIAKACGKYTSMRNYNETLGFTVGAGQMIPGFDKAVEGMKIGQTLTVEIAPKDAYGEWSEQAVVAVPRSQMPTGDYQKGMELMSQMGQKFVIYGFSGENVLLDGNHELAGKTLIFDITLVNIE